MPRVSLSAACRAMYRPRLPRVGTVPDLPSLSLSRKSRVPNSRSSGAIVVDGPLRELDRPQTTGPHDAQADTEGRTEGQFGVPGPDDCPAVRNIRETLDAEGTGDTEEGVLCEPPSATAVRTAPPGDVLSWPLSMPGADPEGGPCLTSRACWFLSTAGAAHESASPWAPQLRSMPAIQRRP